MEETVKAVIAAARNKADMVRTRLGQYFVLSLLAGAYVGFGITLIFAIGAPLQAAGASGMKALMGASFGVALTLVIFAGSELFTGNNMVMTIGSLAREVTWRRTLAVWIVSYAGNLVGSLLLAYATVKAGTITKAPVRDFVLQVVTAKMTAPASELFVRAILCNVLVCLSVWMAMRAKEEIAKLALIFWCLFAFIGAGFEHSVANMTLLGMGLLLPGHPAVITWAGFWHNLVPVSLGNVVGGGLFVGAAYFYAARGARAANRATIVAIPVRAVLDPGVAAAAHAATTRAADQ